MFVILTSKPGQFRTEPVEGTTALEAYDYVFCGRLRARFVIVELTRDVKVRIVDEASPGSVNDVPSKFLPKFRTLDEARRELAQLTKFGSMDIALVRT